MKLSDFTRLKRFMALTTSDSDNEALTAMRKANELLAANDLDWQRVLDRVCQVVPDVEPDPEAGSTSDGYARREDAANADRIRSAFAAVGDPSGDFGKFIRSLREQWDARRRLSPAQQEALFAAAGRAADKTRRQ